MRTSVIFTRSGTHVSRMTKLRSKMRAAYVTRIEGKRYPV